ncbi:hypothetical protein E4U31_006560 [Claviceps sp. LM219 group G6]|nr:hypothetical protein E4U31_006560 [Claviceps sp. LM219 group G6]
MSSLDPTHHRRSSVYLTDMMLAVLLGDRTERGPKLKVIDVSATLAEELKSPSPSPLTCSSTVRPLRSPYHRYF